MCWMDKPMNKWTDANKDRLNVGGKKKKSSPRSPQLEKARAQQRRPNTAKNT